MNQSVLGGEVLYYFGTDVVLVSLWDVYEFEGLFEVHDVFADEFGGSPDDSV